MPQYQYDDFGRRYKVISPDTGTTIYSFDEAGNITQKTDAKGTVVNFAYDALNRITSAQFPADPTQNITYTYDSTSVTNGIGRLTGRTDPSGTYTFYYDARGNVTKEEKTISSVLYTTEYAYNKANALTSITYPTGRTITYTLDVTGRITQVDTTLNGNPKTVASSITYLPYGGITGLTYGNGLSLSHVYDNQYRTSSIIVGSIMNRTYDYDPNGNITSNVDAIQPPGNETLEDAGVYTYQQATNKLTQVEGELNVVYGYDANGNITSANNRTFVYDLSNRLITVQDDGVTIAQYVYNAFNQRIKKILPTGTRIFHYDLSGHLIAETNETGQTLVEYFNLGDQPLAMIRPGEALYYYHDDHLGTPQVLTDESQTVSWKAVYAAFGEAEIQVEAVENPLRFPGQYYDPETGLHYNWNRYYDPRTGRYLTADPIGLEGGTNLFVYVGNNPVRVADPRGLWSYAGTCNYLSGGMPFGIGAGRLRCQVRTICRDDKTRDVGEIVVILGGATAGPIPILPAGQTEFDFELERNPPSSYPMLVDLVGYAELSSISVAVPWLGGYAYTWLRLGMGCGGSFSGQKGIDASIDILSGYSRLENSKKECCHLR